VGANRADSAGGILMTLKSTTRRAALGFGSGTGIALAIFAMPVAAQAQVTFPLDEDEIRTLPVEYRSGPMVEDFEDISVNADGVETITRTRRIETSNPYPAEMSDQYSDGYQVSQGYAPAYYGSQGAAVFQRDQWIDECERRTANRGDREKGGIIGALLGAVTGGIIGNRVANSERLGGTLIGAGVGGLGGLLLGQLIGGGRNERGEYDCAAALDGYLSQYAYGGAARYSPAPAYAGPPVQYGYGYAPAYQGYGYAPPPQVVYVPVQYQVQQRVIVRETVREEVIPGATRAVPPSPRPAPPRYIKGN